MFIEICTKCSAKESVWKFAVFLFLFPLVITHIYLRMLRFVDIPTLNKPSHHCYHWKMNLSAAITLFVACFAYILGPNYLRATST